ncbi:MAG: hypothetical protein ACI4M2_02795 [Christensenellales bacterium]
MEKKKIHYQIEVNGELLITQIPKHALESLALSVGLTILDILKQEKNENPTREEEKRS